MERLEILVNMYELGKIFSNYGLLAHTVKEIKDFDQHHKLLVVEINKKDKENLRKKYNTDIKILIERKNRYDKGNQ